MLTSSVSLTEADWAPVAQPVVEVRRNLTLLGAHTDPAAWPITDFGYTAHVDGVGIVRDAKVWFRRLAGGCGEWDTCWHTMSRVVLMLLVMGKASKLASRVCLEFTRALGCWHLVYGTYQLHSGSSYGTNPFNHSRQPHVRRCALRRATPSRSDASCFTRRVISRNFW